jgi:hypothetical protein
MTKKNKTKNKPENQPQGKKKPELKLTEKQKKQMENQKLQELQQIENVMVSETHQVLFYIRTMINGHFIRLLTLNKNPLKYVKFLNIEISKLFNDFENRLINEQQSVNQKGQKDA